MGLRRAVIAPIALLATCTPLQEPAPSIALSVSVSKSDFAAREPVGVTVTMINTSDKEVILESYVSGGGYLRVRNSKGEVVFPYPRASAGLVIAALPVFAPGERRTDRRAWPGYKYDPSTTNGVVVPVDPGRYEITATVREQLNAITVTSAPVHVTILPEQG